MKSLQVELTEYGPRGIVTSEAGLAHAGAGLIRIVI